MNSLELKAGYNPDQIIRANGVEYTPLPIYERERIIREIAQRNREVEDFLVTLNEDDHQQMEDILTSCMAPGVAGFQYWCEHFCYTLDPRDTRNPDKHFILYPYQVRDAEILITAIREGKNVHLDKSRDMGASWLALAVITWCWIFDNSFHALLGSRVEALVDDYTVDSLFGKIDYIIERLPEWMIPGFNYNKHRRSMKLESPSGNMITGESANMAFGRGPRKNVVYLDEFAHWETDKQVWISLADTSPCKIVTSTPCGKHNQFAKLKFGESDILRITQHWTLHPGKDWAWYERECYKRNYDPVAIAQELDIDYEASAGGLALPALQDERFKPLIIIPRVLTTDAINAQASFYGGLDWGSANPTSFHVYRVRKVQDYPQRVLLIDSVWEYYEPASEVDLATGLKDMAKIAHYIKSNPFFNHVQRIFADPSMWAQNQQGNGDVTSLARLFQERFQIFLVPGQRGDTLALEHLKTAWADPDKILVHISADCPHQLREFAGLRYQKQTSAMAQKRNQPEKLVDKDNHSWDDFKYMFNSYDLDAPLLSSSVDNDKPLVWADISCGWREINEKLAMLKQQKLAKLETPRRNRRRYFRS